MAMSINVHRVNLTFMVISHSFLRATMRAVDAAINSRQWNKAVQILSVAGESEGATRYYVKIAKHFASINELERAEQFFVGAGATEEAIKMYNDHGKWEEAHRVCSNQVTLD